MKIWFGLTSIAVFIGILTTYSAQSANDRELYVALVPKGSVERFYNRLATDTEHLVVTDRQPPQASEVISLTLGPDEDLFIIEPNQQNGLAIPGEVARMGKFVIAKFWQLPKTGHLHLGEIENYVERLNPQMTDLSQDGRKNRRRAHAFSLRRDLRLEIDPAFLQSALEQFSGARPTEIGGEGVTITERGSSTGRANAIAWLKEQYQGLGFTVSTHDYGRGTNFVAERMGRDSSKTIIVSAHLDSVSNAGADDDGAGTISALAIAKALQDYDLRYNLRIVGFDQEELGLVGSARYASYLNGRDELDQIAGVFNIEMTGYDEDNDGHMHVIDCSENTSGDLTRLIMDAIDAYDINLTKVAACTNRSDHASFWRYDVPAIVASQNFFGGDSNPCYHRSCDKTDKINWTYMTEMTKALAYGVASAVVE